MFDIILSLVWKLLLLSIEGKDYTLCWEEHTNIWFKHVCHLSFPKDTHTHKYISINYKHLTMYNNDLCSSFCLMSEIYFYGLASMINCNLNT